MRNLEKIKGSIPPIITPICNGQVDYNAYANLVEYQLNHGSHGILVNGTTAEIPWMIYHIPGRTAVSVTLDSMQELKERSSNFIGMKHAVNDLGFVTECLGSLGNDFKIFVGLEELSFPMMTIGACGLMNAVGNLRPKILSEMCEAIWEGDLEKGRELHQNLLEINQAVFYDTNPIAIKYMMKKLGIMPSNEHRLPMEAATPELEKRLDAVLERASLI